MCRAQFAALSPPRLSRCRSVRPELAGSGAAPHRCANDPSDRSRSGLSPAVTSSWPATSTPTPTMSSSLGATALTSVASSASLDRSSPVLPMMPGMPEKRTHDYVRNGITSLFAALDMASGKVIGALHRRHRSTEYRKFLIRIDKEVPVDLDVHIICDNYATHKTDLIQRWLAAHPRFHIHFVPTSPSWLNMVERWFGELTTKLIQRGVHKSVQALEADIRAWIDNLERRPPPIRVDQDRRRDPRQHRGIL